MFSFEYQLPHNASSGGRSGNVNPFGGYGSAPPQYSNLFSSSDSTSSYMSSSDGGGYGGRGPFGGGGGDRLMRFELENDVPSVVQFPVADTDIGGSLVVELGINNERVQEKNIWES